MDKVNTQQELVKFSQFYESIRENDFSVVNGIGEIVDNSVEAGASKIHVFIHSSKKPGEKKERIDQIVIVDDGMGMDQLVLSKALVLGESIRVKQLGRANIGKFGFGLVTGATSMARRIVIFSRTDTGDFYVTYLDLDEIKSGDMRFIPQPVPQDPPSEYAELLKNSSGTIIIISNCDRMDGFGNKQDVSEQISLIYNFIARTYRKFISAGIEIYVNDKKVFLHDPLYLDGPTLMDEKGHQDPRATVISQKTIEYPIPGDPGKKSPIKITLTLLPKEWRMQQGSGGTPEAKRRHIDQNEGVSILRADREVLYDRVPYLIGTRGGQANYENSDRFWGCEISFSPELDECFQVRYIKRGAEPIGELKDRLRDEISLTIKHMRETIKSDWAEEEAKSYQKAGVYENVESTMASIAGRLPMSKRGDSMSEEDEDRLLDELADDILANNDDATEAQSKEEIKDKLKSKPYSIELIKMPMPTLFEPVILMEKIIIKVNINHPFYAQVLKPLCHGLVDDEGGVELTNRNARIRDAIMILLFSYAKAESQFSLNEVTEELFMNLRTMWATTLSTAVRELYGRK